MTPKSKARAQCDNPARWDLCGGRAETPVPTATNRARLRGRRGKWCVGHFQALLLPSAWLSAACLCAAIMWSANVCSVAGAAVTHKYLKQVSVVGSGSPAGLVVGPVGAEGGSVEKHAVFVADDAGGVERLTAAGAALPFECKTVECAEYIEGDRLTGAPAGAFGRVAGVAVDDATGEVFVSAGGTSVFVFAGSGEFLGVFTEVPMSSGAEVSGPFVRAAGLAFDQATGELYVAVEGKEVPEIPDVVDVFKRTAPGEVEFVSQLGSGVIDTNDGLLQTVAVAEAGLAEAGSVYVTDPPESVSVFNALGTLEATWSGASTPAKSFGTNELYVGIDAASGRVYVNDPPHGVVDEFAGSVTEQYLGQLRGTPTGLEGRVVGFVEPGAVGVSGAAGGDLYVGSGVEGSASGVVDVFGPDIELPEVLATAASGVSATVARLNGLVSTGIGGAAVCSFAWGESEALGRVAGCEGGSVEGEGVPVSVGLSGLAPDTKYFYRLRAAYVSDEEAVNPGEEDTSECDGVKADVECFTTRGAGLVSESTSDVTAVAVTFDASIDPNEAPTSWMVEYGPTEAYGFDSPLQVVGSGKGAVAVSEHVEGLTAATTYYYRVVAVSEGVRYPSGVHTFSTQTAGVSGLIDGRGWELVSPVQKQGALIQGPGEPFGFSQAAAGGGAMTYLANLPTEAGVVGYSNAQQVLSHRGSGGWSSTDLASPHNGAVSGSVEAGEEYRFFSEDLSNAVLQPFGAFQPCVNGEGEAQPCLSLAASEQTAFSRDLASGVATPLVTACPGEGEPCPAAVSEYANVPAGTVFGQRGAEVGGPCPPEKFCGPFFDGASADGDHVVFHAFVQLTGETAPYGGLYEWNQGVPAAQQLKLVSTLPEGKGPEHEASLGTEAEIPSSADGADAIHAVSDDGSRVFWTSRSPNEALYMRDTATGETIQIGGAGAGFEQANATGSLVFYSQGAAAGDECEVRVKAGGGLECALVASLGGSVLGASEDGSWVYFKAGGSVFVRHGGVTSLVAAGVEGLGTALRVSPDGEWLVFMSSASLTGYDNLDAVSGQPDEEAYLYDAADGSLTCVSCNPTGGRPLGVETGLYGRNIPLVGGTGDPEGWPYSAWLSAFLPEREQFEEGVGRYLPRFLSDSGRVFFDSDDALVAGDVNETWDVYEFEPAGVGGCAPGVGGSRVVFRPARGVEAAGCVGLLSSGESAQESVLLDASESGGDVFFMTTAKLSPADSDDSYDVYDAHECTTGSPCINPPAVSLEGCGSVEACRAGGVEPLSFGLPASAGFTGDENAPPPAVVSRHEKLVKALAACHKDRRKTKRVACEKQARKRYGPLKKTKKTAKKTARKSAGKSTARKAAVMGSVRGGAAR